MAAEDDGLVKTRSTEEIGPETNLIARRTQAECAYGLLMPSRPSPPMPRANQYAGKPWVKLPVPMEASEGSRLTMVSAGLAAPRMGGKPPRSDRNFPGC